jgi:integrase
MADKKDCWSYIAGEKGVNRVRAYEKVKGGPLFLEWMEDVVDAETGLAVMDLETGAPKRKRQRLSLMAAGITTYAAAVVKAEETAEKFQQLGSLDRSGPLTLGRLLELYLKEVTPTKKPNTQLHDKQAARMFRTFFGDKAVVEQGGLDGKVKTELGRARYNDFMKARREGRIQGFPRRVRNRIIEYDIKFLRAVFNWATVERPDGVVLLTRNPWKGFPVPAESNPARPEMTEDLHERLKANAPDWRMPAVMELCRETRHRRNSVRQLQWSDLSLTARTVRWRGEFDKTGKESVTPLSERAVVVLRGVPRVLGSPWVFPAPMDATRPVSNETLNLWMQRTKERLGLDVRGLGYHGEKRAGVRDPRFRALAPAVQEAISGTAYDTLKKVYDYVDLDDMREAVAELERELA